MAAVRKASSIDSNLGLTFNVQSTLFFFFAFLLLYQLSALNYLSWKKCYAPMMGKRERARTFWKKGEGRYGRRSNTHTRDGMLCMKVQCPGAETTSSTCSEPQDRRTFISLRTSVLLSWNFFLKQTTKWVIFETRILTKTLKTRFFFSPSFYLVKKKIKKKRKPTSCLFCFCCCKVSGFVYLNTRSKHKLSESNWLPATNNFELPSLKEWPSCRNPVKTQVRASLWECDCASFFPVSCLHVLNQISEIQTTTKKRKGRHYSKFRKKKEIFKTYFNSFFFFPTVQSFLTPLQTKQRTQKLN